MPDFEHIVKNGEIYDVSDPVARAAVEKKQDIFQFTELPESSALLGRVVQYIGETTANYTRNYFYKNNADMEQTTTSSAQFNLTNQDKFNALLAFVGERTGGNVFSMDISINQNQTIINIYYLDENGNRLPLANTFSPAQFTDRTGLTYTGTLSPSATPDLLDISMTWERTDVQPREDYTAITGFDSTAKQMLVHDANSNSLKWETIA